MKKIISVFLTIILGNLVIGNVFAINDPKPCNPACDEVTTTCDNTLGICMPKDQSNNQTAAPTSCSEYDNERKDTKQDGSCNSGYVVDGFSTEAKDFTCCRPADSNTSTTTNAGSPTSVMGITCDPTLLVNGQCKLNIYDTLGIRKSTRDTGDSTSVGLFVQDVVLSATMFIGTLVTVALIVS